MTPDHIDLTSDCPASREPAESAGRRPYLGVHFTCCRVYSRIYRNREATAYVGHCPRCGRRLAVGISPGGSDRRFFTAS